MLRDCGSYKFSWRHKTLIILQQVAYKNLLYAACIAIVFTY